MDPFSLILASGVTKAAATASAKYAASVGAVKLGQSVLTRAGNMLANGQTVRSLADYSRPARVEPIVMVEDTLTDVEAMQDIMKCTASLFIGYYLQAAVFAGTKVGTISPLRVLDQLNPNRNFNLAREAKEMVFSKEAWAEGMPSFEDFSEAELPSQRLVFEVSTEAAPVPAAGTPKDDKPKTEKVGNDVSSDKYYEIPNLVVGKMIDVTIKEGDQEAKIPVLIRLVPTALKSATFTHIFTAVSKDNTIRQQIHMWRAGQISFWRDLVFQTHLIDQHRQALVEDKSNIYQTITARRRNNSLAAASGDSPSMADASNVMIISKETAREIGKKLYGSIESVKVRKRIFDSSYLLLLVIVDELNERVTIYHRGYDQPTVGRFQDIKASEKGKGPDFTEILKAYLQGSTPNIL